MDGKFGKTVGDAGMPAQPGQELGTRSTFRAAYPAQPDLEPYRPNIGMSRI